MTQTATALSLFAFLFIPGFVTAAPTAGASASREILYADPTIYSENGRYYLTGTRNAQPPAFALLESDNPHGDN